MLHTRLAPMVAKTLAREGVTAILSQPPRESERTYNPSTGEMTGGTTATCSVKIVMLDFGLVSNGLQSKAGTTISIDDKEVYLSPLDVNGAAFPKTLMPNDKLTIGSEVWNILTIKEYAPNTVNNIMYKLLVKR